MITFRVQTVTKARHGGQHTWWRWVLTDELGRLVNAGSLCTTLDSCISEARASGNLPGYL